MPELPEVETVCQGLNQLTLSEQILGGDVLLDRTIAHPFLVGDFLANITGITIAQWQRRGKYLLAQLKLPPTAETSNPPTSAGWLGIHLRMSGQLLWLDRNTPLQKHTRVRIFFTNNHELRFVDQRTFGKIWWVPPTTQPAHIITGLKTLGPEPFAPEFNDQYLANKLKNSHRPIKTALLDQTLVAGIGNIYADEALFISQILPTTLCSNLTSPQITRLRSAIIQVLQTALAAGGTTFSNFINVHGVNGNYAGIAWVYNRTGQPCHTCHTPITRLKLAGRSSHFCPQCQT